MSVVGGIMVPHPPLILPEVGRGEEACIQKTAKAYEEAAQFVADLAPETIVLSSPHSVMYADYLHISPGERAFGDMGQFRAGSVRIEREYDTALAERIADLARKDDLPAGFLGEKNPNLDHGTLIPLYFILKKYTDFRLVRLGISGISLAEHYRIGQKIQQAAKELGRRVVYVASGDLSHKLKEDGPYGFAKEGPAYDERIMKDMGSADFGALLRYDPAFLDRAAECGHRSFVLLAGALDGKAVEARCLSHEGVTGVGYGVCTYRVTGEDESRHFLASYEKEALEKAACRRAKADPYVTLAQRTIDLYLTAGIIPSAKDPALQVPEELLTQRAGAFVSLHEHGELRGCIGTILPVRKTLAEEIIQNAVSAATEDPRFPAVRREELPYLEISVDVLEKPEDIRSKDELDVKKYGVIVTKGSRRGLLLPDLEGVDTVDEQIRIAKRKAGIGDWEDVSLQRFAATRHQ